ncbi:MAG: amidohydrolase family protein [Ilumatobacter sp.]
MLTAADPADLTDAAVRISGTTIDAIGSWTDLSRRYPHDVVTGGPYDIVTPGFVNTHGHFSEALVAGIAEQYTLWEWIQAVIHAINPVLDAEMAYVGTQLAGLQMLHSGIRLPTTCSCAPPSRVW